MPTAATSKSPGPETRRALGRRARTVKRGGSEESPAGRVVQQIRDHAQVLEVSQAGSKDGGDNAPLRNVYTRHLELDQLLLWRHMLNESDA